MSNWDIMRRAAKREAMARAKKALKLGLAPAEAQVAANEMMMGMFDMVRWQMLAEIREAVEELTKDSEEKERV
jgi:hypothetical protein